MFKKFGALAMMLTASCLFVHPSLGIAQERYNRDGNYSYNYRDNDNRYRDYGSRSFREEREERKWREKELRRRERWERENYRNRARNYDYSYHDYRAPYRPY